MAESCMGGQNKIGGSSEPLNAGGWGSDPAANGASRIEGVIDSYLLAKRTNEPYRAGRYFNSSALCGLFLMNLQLNETDCKDFPSPVTAVGGTPLSFNDNNIRIDYVQHAVVVLVKILVYAHSDNNI